MIAGIIAGSGAESLEPFKNWDSCMTQTRYGVAEVRRGEIHGRTVLFVPRHGSFHSTAPHLVNYRAIVTALKDHGAERVIGTAAVGSLTTDLAPGTTAVLTDFIDFTRSDPVTFFDTIKQGVVHTDFTEPYCSDVSNSLLNALEKEGLEVTTPCTYICADGPRYETPAELSMFRAWGADVVGMTNAPEAILCREAGLCYGAVAIITNYAAGLSPTPLSHAEVVSAMSKVQERLALALTGAVATIPDQFNCLCRK